MPDDRSTSGTPSASDSSAPPVRREGWTVPKPCPLPRPTLWPVVAAFGITLLLWGVVTAYLIAAVGAGLLGGATLGWIGELRRER